MAELTVAELKSNKVFQDKWYHSIELLPNLFTNGKKFPNIHLTRTMLRDCEIEGMNCLDVGAQDCLTSILLKRRNASKVVAQDLQPKNSHVDLLKKVLGIDFDYISGCRLTELRSICKYLGVHPFDVVVFSGVLYHMLDPLTGLALMRGMLRNGGLFVLETAAAVDSSMIAHFNANGRFLTGTNYWQISLECLDYLLRLLRLEPLNCVYYLSPKPRTVEICRIAIVCQATDRVLVDESDEWAIKMDGNIHFKEFLDWKELKTKAPKLTYSGKRDDLIFRKDTGTLNLYETVRATNELVVDSVEDQVYLKLDAIY